MQPELEPVELEPELLVLLEVELEDDDPEELEEEPVDSPSPRQADDTTATTAPVVSHRSICRRWRMRASMARRSCASDGAC
jgi:hypothetical protein